MLSALPAIKEDQAIKKEKKNKTPDKLTMYVSRGGIN